MNITNKAYLCFLVMLHYQKIILSLTSSQFILNIADYSQSRTIGDFCINCLGSPLISERRKNIKIRLNFTANPFINLNFYGLKLKNKYNANGQVVGDENISGFIMDHNIIDGYLFSVTLVDEFFYHEIINQKLLNISNQTIINNSNNNTILNNSTNNTTINNTKNNTISNNTIGNNTIINNSTINNPINNTAINNTKTNNTINNSTNNTTAKTGETFYYDGKNDDYDLYMKNQSFQNFFDPDNKKNITKSLFINRESFPLYMNQREYQKAISGIDYTILPKYCLFKDLTKKERFMEIHIENTVDLNNKLDIKLYIDGELLDNKFILPLFSTKLSSKELSTIRVRAEKPFIRYYNEKELKTKTISNINLRSNDNFFVCPEGLFYDIFTGTCLKNCDYWKSLNSTAITTNCTCSRNYKEFVACPSRLEKAPIFFKTEENQYGTKIDFLHEKQNCKLDSKEFNRCECTEDSYYAKNFDACLKCASKIINGTCTECKENLFLDENKNCTLCGKYCDLCDKANAGSCSTCANGYVAQNLFDSFGKINSKTCSYQNKNCKSLSNFNDQCICYPDNKYDSKKQQCVFEEKPKPNTNTDENTPTINLPGNGNQSRMKDEILDFRLFYGTCFDALSETFPPNFCWKKDTDRTEIDPTVCPKGLQYKNNFGTGKGCAEPCTIMFPEESVYGLSEPNCCQKSENDYYAEDSDLKCDNLNFFKTHFGKCFKREFYNFDSPLSQCPAGFYKDLWKCRPDCKAIGMENCGVAACARDTGACVGGVFEMIGETFVNLFTLGTASSIKNYIASQVKKYSKDKLKDVLENNINLIRNVPLFSKLTAIAKSKITKKKKQNYFKNILKYETPDFPENSCQKIYNDMSQMSYNSNSATINLDSIVNALDVFNVQGIIDSCSDTSEYNDRIACARNVVQQVPIGVVSLAAVFLKQTCESILDTPSAVEDQENALQLQQANSQYKNCLLLYDSVDYSGNLKVVCEQVSVYGNLYSFPARSFISRGAYGILFAGEFGNGIMFPFGKNDEESNMNRRKATDKCGIPLNESYYKINSFMLINPTYSFSSNWCFVYDYYDSNGRLYNRLLPNGELINSNPIDFNVNYVDLIITARAYLEVGFGSTWLKGNKYIKKNFKVEFSMSFSYSAYYELIGSRPNYYCKDLKSSYVNNNFSNFVIIILLLMFVLIG